MTDNSPTAHSRSACDARLDAPTLSQEGVEVDVADDYRLPREANRALVHVIMAVRDRMLGSGKGVA